MGKIHDRLVIKLADSDKMREYFLYGADIDDMLYNPAFFADFAEKKGFSRDAQVSYGSPVHDLPERTTSIVYSQRDKYNPDIW